MRLRQLCVLLAALVLSAPASAAAAEQVLRPVATYETGLWILPEGTTMDGVLSDPLVAPTDPEPFVDYTATMANGPVVAEVGLAAPVLTATDAVSGLRAYAYFATGSGRSLSLELRSGSTVLGSIDVPAGQAAAWHSFDVAPSLAGDFSDLRLRATAQGSGATTTARLYTAYAVLDTAAPPVPGSDVGTGSPGTGDPAPPVDPGDTISATDDPVPDPPAVPVTLPALGTLPAAANGTIAVPLTCRLAAGCTGYVSVRLVTRSTTSARRRKAARKRARRGRSRFRLAAGQSKRVAVRLDRRSARAVRRRGRAKLAVTVAVDGAAPVTKQVTVVQRRVARRRR